MPAAPSLLLLAAAQASLCAAFTVVPEQSMSGPFQSFDAEGFRNYPGWRLGGSTSLQENFVRLTNDRAGKRSSLWSTTRMGMDDWSTTIRFRVSGQGKRLFGDGLAFWFTSSETHKDGTLHGFQDTFKGFGIIFDTFVNSEPGHVHKDIKLVTSDGSSPAKDEVTPIGCDADFRYWEGRDDVSVYNHSAARVRFAGGRVSLWIDAKATGNFVSCFEGAALAPGLAEGWWRESGGWLGLTATTGELADNHDLLSLLTGPEDEVAPKNWLDPRPELVLSGNEEFDRAIRSAIAYETWEMRDRLSFLEHKLEHELATLEDSVKVALRRLQEQEKDNSRRIQELEGKLGEKMKQQIEGALDNTVSSRINSITESVKESVNTQVQKVQELSESVAKGGRSWVFPFTILAVLVLALVGWSWMFSAATKRRLDKPHLG